MDRLGIVLTLMSGAVLTGGRVIIAFSFGVSTRTAIALCAVAGFALSRPTAHAISRLTKRNDPHWDHTPAPPTPRSDHRVITGRRAPPRDARRGTRATA